MKKKKEPKWLKEWRQKKKAEWEAGRESRKRDWLEERARLRELDYKLKTTT